MADVELSKLLKKGIREWNTWRRQHPDRKIDLSGANLREADLYDANLREADLYDANLREADLRKADLYGANLGGTDLSGADLSGADLYEADLSGADLSGANLREACFIGANLGIADLSRANLSGADLSRANLSIAYLIGANLSGADLSRANLSRADLYGANLSGANLREATIVETNMRKANLINCSIYGISVWNVELGETIQENLVITREGEPTITVDNLKIAQFLYLLLNNAEIRDVIETITTKVVLILGRFSPERKVVLDALREALRTKNYLPILFDFEKPSSRNFTETVRALAHLAKFIIADLTDPSSIPQELQAIIPILPIPVQPILLEGKRDYAMFRDFQRYSWVLPTYYYEDQASLLASLQERIIEPAEQKAKELELP